MAGASLRVSSLYCSIQIYAYKALEIVTVWTTCNKQRVKILLRCQSLKGTSVQLLNSHLQICRLHVYVCVFTFANEQTICLSKYTYSVSEV